MTIASILVVDDDESSRSIVVSALRDVGHFVRESRDFGAALVEVEQSNPDRGIHFVWIKRQHT